VRPEVLTPTSAAEAAEAFGDGSGVTVLGGGTIVMPELSHGRLRPERVLLLSRAGLTGVSRANGVVSIAAATPIVALEGGDEPLASAAAHVADPEIRAQATVGGNLCAGPAAETPRGDLQAPLLALGARVRSTGEGGERTEPLEDFLADGTGRLLLAVEYDEAARSAAFASVRRPHAHHYSILAVCAVRSADDVCVAVAGAGPRGRRCPAVEAAARSGASPAEAADRVLDDVGDALQDDALASAWYRRQVLPGLVARALADLKGES
jgi:CO/xanthine dehydrogenase FAD-binding subunit